MDWVVLSLIIAVAIPLLAVTAVLLFLVYILRTYAHVVVRIFEEKPLFIIPKGPPLPGAEEVRFPTAGGLNLAGSYLRTPLNSRRGVILFGTEFGSNRWSCHAYCKQLLLDGYDIFTFEFRNTGDSDAMAGYEPLQWVTEYEAEDTRAAIAYLKNRADADPEGIGLFGISRGGGAGIVAAAEDRYVRCIATDGAFATLTTMLPYMKKWAAIYSGRLRLQKWLPFWFWTMLGKTMIRRIERKRHCAFPKLESAVGKIGPRPLLMIHGGGDTYIKPESARSLFSRAKAPKEFWLVEGAKHNMAIQSATAEYHRRVVGFFHQHLSAAVEPEPVEQLAATA